MQYHYNSDGELDWFKDANRNTLTISAKENNQRIVTDSTGRTMTVYTYYPASETAEIAGLIRTITDGEGHTTEYTYGTSGYAKGLSIKKEIKDEDTVVNSVEYEYNSQLQVSKEKASVDISKNVYTVKEYEYDSFNNVMVVRDYDTEYDRLQREKAAYF